MFFFKLIYNIILIIILIKLNSAGNINITDSTDSIKNSTFRIGKITDSTESLNNSTFRIGKSKLESKLQQCTTQSELTGLCMKRSECTRNNGIASGYCGSGVCCELNLKCSGSSKLKKTIIRNPEKLPQQCVYHFQPYSSRVCQLRVDFDIELAQPSIIEDTNGISSVECRLDKFIFGDYTICGTNVKQHVYLNLDTENGFTDVILSFKLGNREQNPNIPIGYWNLIVTQLECPSVYRSNQNILSNYKILLKQPLLGDFELLAPRGCLQYYHEPEGIIESFNYNDGVGPYLSGMRYGICFKRTSDYEGVQLSAYVFEMGAANIKNDFIDSDCHSRSFNLPNTISNDYLAIPESVLATSPTGLFGTFYCGNSLQGKELLHAPPGPFAIYFNSDNLYSKYPEIGFKIKYMRIKLNS